MHWMESFIEFCAGTRLAKAIVAWRGPPTTFKAEVEQCPEAIQAPSLLIECGHLLCIESTENTSGWKEVRVKNRAYFFCSEPCYHEWLGHPQYQNLSPSVPVTLVTNPPPFEL